MGKAGVVGRIVFSTCLNSNLGLNSRFSTILTEIYFQSILQCIDSDFQRVIGDILVRIAVTFGILPSVLVFFFTGGKKEAGGHDSGSEDFIHGGEFRLSQR